MESKHRLKRLVDVKCLPKVEIWTVIAKEILDKVVDKPSLERKAGLRLEDPKNSII